MADLTNISKHSASLTKAVKSSHSGKVFYGWLFWFTRPFLSTHLTNVPKHTGALTGIAKH
jgi:hypothetical protein